MTALAHYRTSDPTMVGTPEVPTVRRAAQKAMTAAAVLVDSFFFARDMRSASTPAARRTVLDRFAA